MISHAELGDRRAERAHAERDDVHRPARHAAVEEAVEDRPSSPPGPSSCSSDRRRLSSSSRCTCGPRPGRRRSGRSGRGSCSAPLLGFSRMNVPASTISAHRRSYSSSDPSHQWTSAGLQSSAISATQRFRPSCCTYCGSFHAPYRGAIRCLRPRLRALSPTGEPLHRVSASGVRTNERVVDPGPVIDPRPERFGLVKSVGEARMYEPIRRHRCPWMNCANG